MESKDIKPYSKISECWDKNMDELKELQELYKTHKESVFALSKKAFSVSQKVGTPLTVYDQEEPGDALLEKKLRMTFPFMDMDAAVALKDAQKSLRAKYRDMTLAVGADGPTFPCVHAHYIDQCYAYCFQVNEWYKKSREAEEKYKGEANG